MRIEKMTADRIVAVALGMSEQAIEVSIRGGGKVTLVVDANLLTMDTADRQFVFGLVDAFHDYDSQQEAERPSAVSPEGGDEESLAIALKVAPAAIHDAMRRDTWSKRGGERGSLR